MQRRICLLRHDRECLTQRKVSLLIIMVSIPLLSHDRECLKLIKVSLVQIEVRLELVSGSTGI
jgi:hypothetical protein